MSVAAIGRCVAVAALGAVVIRDSATAQEGKESPIAVHAAISLNHVDIYEGDATVGPVSVRGWSGSFGIRSSRHVGGDLLVSWSPRDDDPYNRAPELVMLGAWVTIGFDETPGDGLDIFAGAGLARFTVRGWPDFSGCRIELGCFNEGGPNFENGAAVTSVYGGGISYSWHHVLVRLDYKFIGASDRIRQDLANAGLGIGLVIS